MVSSLNSTPAVYGRASVFLAVVLFCLPRICDAQGLFEFEKPPIDYHQTIANNPITELQAKLDQGKITLKHSYKHGYLPDLMKLLEVSPTTQALVYSKSSLQLRRIDPAKPRAMYFNDQLYLGWVQGGDVVEIIAADPKLGSVFYTLPQQPTDSPRFIRDKGQCLQCHAARRTQNVPGPVVRSLFTSHNGQPVFNFGTYVSDHTSPFAQRWGGYYVTGTHGNMRHMGNILVDANQGRGAINYDDGANVTDLSTMLNTKPYITNESDVVALMVLEHQTQMQNLITFAHYEDIRGREYDKSMNAALDRDPNFKSEFTKRRTTRSIDNLVRYLLFANEFQLTAPVTGTSSFTETFSKRKPCDNQGRSLYQLDLQQRLFRYPLSYMIYSPSFKQLPHSTLKLVAQKLHQILTTDMNQEGLDHLTPKLKLALVNILKQTHPQIVKYW